MASTSLLTVARDATNAVSQISRGRDVNEDSWMVMWCNTNWGDLLQPAPLSIALLGSLMAITSSASDFSLISENNETATFKYMRYPTSFKSCLQQMVSEGYTAFETASHQMTRINNASSQLPDAIKKAVTIILQSPSPTEVDHFLPVALESVLELTNICLDASQTCENGFAGICLLIDEITLCATNKNSTAEKATQRNKWRIAYLKEQEEQEKKVLEEAKQTSDLMRKSFAAAEDGFKAAVNRVPSGWDIVGMNVVENLMNAAAAPMNALLGWAKVKSDRLQTVSSPLPETRTQPSGEVLSDPGLGLAPQVLELVSVLKRLISDGPGGKPDWDEIRGGHSKSGGYYVQAGLEWMRDRLDNTKPISSDLRYIVDQAITITDNVEATAASTRSQDDKALDKHKPVVNEMIKQLQGIVTRCNLILQQTGNPATITRTQNIILHTASAAQAAVETAKFRVDQTRASLEAARESYEQAATRLIEGQRAIAKTIGKMTQMNLENATLKEIMPVLTEALKSFTTLRAQFSQMTEFFLRVASLISDVMRPQVSSLVNHIRASSNIVIAGTSLSDFARQLMYTEMMCSLKVSMLAERISRTYLTVSSLYIMPAQREVGHMLQFQGDMSEEGRRLFTFKLGQAQAALEQKAKKASEEIGNLVAKDQQEFADRIDKRLKMISDTVRLALPAIDQPVPRAIAMVTETHVREVYDQRIAIEEAKPSSFADDWM